MSLEDIEAKIRAAQDADKAARDARSEAELGKLFEEHPEYFGPGYIVEKFPGVRADLCGVVVMRLPTAPEYQRFREGILGQGASVKARALHDLAASCRVYPDKDAFKALQSNGYTGIADQCANVLSAAADGKEREAGKG